MGIAQGMAAGAGAINAGVNAQAEAVRPYYEAMARAEEAKRQREMMEREAQLKRENDQAAAQSDANLRLDRLMQIMNSQSIGGRGRLKSFADDGMTIEFPLTDAEYQQQTDRKAQETAAVAAEKDKQTNLAKVGRLDPILTTIEDQWLQTNPGEGGGGRASGILASLTAGLQSNPEQQRNAAYTAFSKGLRAQLVRSMGDVGNMSAAEQKTAEELIPKVSDSKETGQLKLKMLREFMTNLQQRNSTGGGKTAEGQGAQQVEDPLGLR